MKNEGPEGLYFHHELLPNQEQVYLSVEEAWDENLTWCREGKEASQCGAIKFHIQSAKLVRWASCSSCGAPDPSTYICQCLSSDSLQRWLCEGG